jgi:hypothetical protein
MKSHQGYYSKENKAKCSECGSWISKDEECVLMLPASIGESGRVNTNAKTIHGVLCMDCYTEK